MKQAKTIAELFPTMEPIYHADLVAVEMKSGHYYIYKNKNNNYRGFVSRIQFKAALCQSSSPIVLHENYVDMSNISERHSFITQYHLEREELMRTAMKYELALGVNHNLMLKTNKELKEFIESMKEESLVYA